MGIDWANSIEDILSGLPTCPRCGTQQQELLDGHSQEPWAAYVAPRCVDCTDKADCDSRKLVFLCRSCARELGLRGRPVDEEGMMALLLDECRADLMDSLDYLADYWQEDLDIEPDQMDVRLEVFAPAVFQEELAVRDQLEDEYLGYHRWYRAHQIPVPEPQWRSRYVEDVVGLGYSTKLGD